MKWSTMLFQRPDGTCYETRTRHVLRGEFRQIMANGAERVFEVETAASLGSAG